ncbi:MAG TPA: hypothetical protein PLS71_15010 [Leptospiraceae bacterium]|nr:hypothetical protein [Leptospiraceae bacterium]
MKFSIRKLIEYLHHWGPYIPTSKKDYFLHIILFFDLIFILFLNSYEAFLPKIYSGAAFLFDMFVVTLWGVQVIFRIGRSPDKFEYISTNWYLLPGLVPFPIFRFFLALATLKLMIITYKFIKRGEKDTKQFIKRELNFRFIDLFVDAISDAIFLRSLERVEEVVEKMDFQDLTKDIIAKNKNDLGKVVRETLESKNFMKRVNALPFMQEVTSKVSDEVTEAILETLSTQVVGQMMKEVNLRLLHVMDDRVRKLSLDRITEEDKKKS